MEIETLSEVAGFLRKESLALEISYGSGGFCVILRHTKTKAIHYGYAWDIGQALNRAISSYWDTGATSALDEETSPGNRKNPKIGNK